ncbi:MAG: acyltransferase [Gammaproteobacteria bacterium]|nr:acyltransferase [Gammaproteobacteria bacterium]
MKKEFSLYLDLVRFLAAVVVLVNHANHRGIITEVLPQYGHSAVMVFFLLSGYVIAYVTSEKERVPRDYAVSRLARIYSVAPVALIVTLLADTFGQMIGMRFYEGVATNDFVPLRFFTSLFFLNEIWTVSITSFSNVPYWSLNYEVWYYVMFGVFMFMQGRARVIVLVMICLLLGPKVLLLAPIWWMGVYLYHSRFWAGIGVSVGWIAFVGSLVAIVLFHQYGVEKTLKVWLESQIGEQPYHLLAYSRSFISDWLLGALVFLNFAGFRAIAHQFGAVLTAFARPIRYLAGYTFVLYLTHQPLIWFFATLIDGSPDTSLYLWQVLACVIVTVWLLGQVTERRKGFYRGLSERIVDVAESLWVRARLLAGGKA